MKPDIQQHVEDGAIFYVSHSGGKDSQAMYSMLIDIVPHDRIVVVHADLGEVEWTGVQGHIKTTVSHDLNVVRASKTLLSMVESRFATRPEVPSWPSAAHRQCTSDLKRGPIEKFIRNDMKSKGATLAVNCMGLRAEESSSRAKKIKWALNKTLSRAGRTVHNWLPIHDWSIDQVWSQISKAGQEPFWAYKTNERLSCVFCIMGSDNDLIHGAKENPELAQKYIDLERRTGYSMFHKRSLESVVGKYIKIVAEAA
ncbi:phosphoadenosine phosphosulfate reductase family protein [uncultured Paraglaciecola sp.]|uniref:phosphoadenosine phosphosulfate reductase domain-containing protein n=1 Tax=uncultured Paraglaciecola sp. TaxID=1765024 RepID=UPI0026387A5F|nr:phosphoadenosine phosphosulfate reductase family protein [uncultured Paraglaciecola sp.]